MPSLTQEQITQARETDLLDYLLSHESGVLKQEGANYRHNEHDSLVYVASKNYWYWNSRGRKINAVDYLMEIRGYSFVDAVEHLIGSGTPVVSHYTAPSRREQRKPVEKKPFHLPREKRCATFAVSYLQRRGVHSDIIRRCMQLGLFYESRYNNEAVCVFVGRDDTGTGRFACVRGIAGDLKKTSAAVISGLASATRRISQAAATWRFLKLRLTPFPTQRSKSWRDGNGMATAFPWVGPPMWPWSLFWSATRRSPVLPSIWTMTLPVGSTPGKSSRC